LLPKFQIILPVSGAKGHHVYVASSTTGLTSDLLSNEIGSGDEAGYEASGSTKIGDGKIDGGDGEIDGAGDKKTYPAPKRFSVDELEAMMMDVDTAQIPSASVSSGKRKFSALQVHNDTSSISLLSSEPTATSDMTTGTSEPAGKK
jgi:hypothetical protein